MKTRVLLGVFLGLVAGIPQGFFKFDLDSANSISVNGLSVISAVGLCAGVLIALTLLQQNPDAKTNTETRVMGYYFFLSGSFSIGGTNLIAQHSAGILSEIHVPGYVFLSAGVGLALVGVLSRPLWKT